MFREDNHFILSASSSSEKAPMRRFVCLALLGSCLVLVPTLIHAADPAPHPTIGWKKTVVDNRFQAEGVAVADVNKDGKKDLINGECWYEAPDWKAHRIRPGKDNWADGEKNVYSESFACWADDINNDGWVDVIVIPFPGKPCHWYENPQGKEGMWKQHEIWHSACNETPTYVDLFGKGKRVLLMGFQPKGKDNEGQMAYFTPGKDPTKPWEMHPISEPSTPAKEVNGKKVPANIIPGTFKFAHGLGVGDVNADGRMDVIVPQGWWEQPEKDDGHPWKFHKAALGDSCADMFATDLDGDKVPDVISSSAHNYGIWYFQQRPSKMGEDPVFIKKEIFPRLVSQTHAMHFVDINGDGLKDMVTGKRWWAHGPKGDADPNAPAFVYWFEAKKASDGVITFTPRPIDDDSGIGTQFEVTDINGDGKLDVITCNKKGLFILEQTKK
jgi:hypothetical protein